MKWRNVTGSSCDCLSDRELPKYITVSEVLFSILIGKQTYVGTSYLDVAAMMRSFERMGP